MRSCRGRDQRADLRRIAQIGVVMRGAHAQRRDLGDAGGDRVGVGEPVQHHVAAKRRQRFRRGEADATQGAGDQRRFAIEHGVSSGSFGRV
jgi:hypothetical protein